jgi:hypothetical protein
MEIEETGEPAVLPPFSEIIRAQPLYPLVIREAGVVALGTHFRITINSSVHPKWSLLRVSVTRLVRGWLNLNDNYIYSAHRGVIGFGKQMENLAHREKPQLLASASEC